MYDKNPNKETLAEEILCEMLQFLQFKIRNHKLTVAVSFLSAYAALWLSLLCDELTILYNRLYENITTTEGASADTEATDDEAAAAEDAEVPEMHEKP